jgi:hypothetical protein
MLATVAAASSCIAAWPAGWSARPKPRPPEPPTPEEGAATTTLWRNVLARALADSLGIDHASRKDIRPLLASQARTWLSKPSRDRDQICDWAGLHPSLIEAALPRLRDLWRAADEGRLPAEFTTTRGRRKASAPTPSCYEPDCPGAVSGLAELGGWVASVSGGRLQP